MEKKWKSYFVELLIVIIGVSIAFWLSQIAEEKREDVVRTSYLNDIQSDLKDDLKSLDNAIEFNAKKIDRTYEVVTLFSDADDNRIVIVGHSMEILSYGFFSPKNFTYKSMIASGDFKLIKDNEIKRELVKLHSRYQDIDNLQINFLQAMDDSFIPLVMQNIDMTTGKSVNPNFHKDLSVKNFFIFTVNDLSHHVSSYNDAKKSILKLDSLINEKLK